MAYTKIVCVSCGFLAEAKCFGSVNLCDRCYGKRLESIEKSENTK